MSVTVWAQPGLKWEGFSAHAYVLDSEKVWKLPLQNVSSGQEVTIGSIVETFRGQKVEVNYGTLDVAIKSESTELVVKGPNFYLRLLEFLYRFADQDYSPCDVLWFYYDSDECRDEPHNIYSFFLVSGDKILDERYY